MYCTMVGLVCYGTTVLWKYVTPTSRHFTELFVQLSSSYVFLPRLFSSRVLLSLGPAMVMDQRQKTMAGTIVCIMHVGNLVRSSVPIRPNHFMDPLT